MMKNNYHKPVLLTESIVGLNIKKDGIYVDVTFGGGKTQQRDFKKSLRKWKIDFI